MGLGFQVSKSGTHPQEGEGERERERERLAYFHPGFVFSVCGVRSGCAHRRYLGPGWSDWTMDRCAGLALCFGAPFWGEHSPEKKKKKKKRERETEREIFWVAVKEL